MTETVSPSAPPHLLATLALSVAGVLVAALAFSVFRAYWRLRHVPGPFLAKFTDFQRMFWVKTMRAQEIHWEAHQKYGDCVRFGPNTVSLSDPAAIPELYPVRPGFPKVCACALSASQTASGALSTSYAQIESLLPGHHALCQRWCLTGRLHHSR